MTNKVQLATKLCIIGCLAIAVGCLGAWVRRLDAHPAAAVRDLAASAALSGVHRQLNFSASGVTTSDVVLGTKTLYGDCKCITFQVTNASGGSTLTHFAMQRQLYAGGPWLDYLEGSDWSSTFSTTLLHCSHASPATLAPDSTADADVDPHGAWAVRWVVRAGATASNVTLRGYCQSISSDKVPAE